MKTQNLKLPIVIMAFSMFDDLIDDCAYAYHALPGYELKQVLGCFNGHQEAAYMITLSRDQIDREAQLSELVQSGKFHGQDCILYSDEYRATELIDCETGEITEIGTLVQIPEEEAKTCHGYTLEPETSTYWTAKK